MIVIDTHIWIWWVHGHTDLKPWMRDLLLKHESSGIGISVISCWEIARLVADSKLDLNRPVASWFGYAFDYPGVQLLDLSPGISIDANQLPGEIHKDPADRIIIATARVFGCELLTADQTILNYSGVKSAKAAE